MQSRELRELSAEDLNGRVAELERSYFQLRLDHAAGALRVRCRIRRV